MSQIVNIEEYVYQKVKKMDVPIVIPHLPIFFQEYNHRTIIGIFPQFATWSDNSICELQIVKISEKSIQKTSIRTSSKELSDIVQRFDHTNKSAEELLKDKVVRYLKDFYLDDRVSKPIFVAKYEKYLKDISEIIN